MSTTFDAEGRTTSSGESGNATSYGYNLDDLPVTATLPGGTGVQEVMGYDKANQLTHLALAGPTAVTNPLSNTYDYTYSPLGWTTATTTTLNGSQVVQQDGHDGLGRLTGVGGGPSWGYDANGNITSTVSGGVTSVYSYAGAAAPNELQAVSTGSATTYYGYDKSGDTTSITGTSGVNTSLAYDSQARLSRSRWPTGPR